MSETCRILLRTSCASLLALVTLTIAGLAQEPGTTAKEAEGAMKCEGIPARASDDALECGEILADLREIEAALSSPTGPAPETLKRIRHKNLCRGGRRDAALGDYFKALDELNRVNEDARREGERRDAEIKALQRTVDAICAAEMGAAVATMRQPTPGGPCAKAMMAVQAAIKAAMAAEKKKDPGIERAVGQVDAAAMELQEAWEARRGRLEQLSTNKGCPR